MRSDASGERRQADGRVPLASALDDPVSKRDYTRRLFATIADRYDLITVLLSYGRDRAWKRRLLRLAAVKPGERVLDLACGTGDLTFPASHAGGRTIGLDVTPRMIQLARERQGGRDGPSFLVGDMMALPFPDRAFDVVLTGYGIRNVPVLAVALDEIARVLVPGGRFLSLDFNRPAFPPLRFAYLAYLTLVGSLVGMTLHRDPDTYRYIPETIRRYPGAAAVVQMLRERGFDQARWVPALGGLMAIHVARRARTDSSIGMTHAPAAVGV